jgi:hypothetical protein
MLCGHLYQLQKTKEKCESINIECCRRSKMSVEGWLDGHMGREGLSYYIYSLFLQIKHKHNTNNVNPRRS